MNTNRNDEIKKHYGYLMTLSKQELIATAKIAQRVNSITSENTKRDLVGVIMENKFGAFWGRAFQK